MTTVVVNSCGQNSNTKKEVTVKNELLSDSDAKSAVNSLWEPIVRYSEHDIVLGMSHDEVRKYFGTPNDSSYNVGTNMGVFTSFKRSKSVSVFFSESLLAMEYRCIK